MNKLVLIISHFSPCPAQSGESVRLRNLIRFYRSREYRVVLLLKGDFDKETVRSDNKDLVDTVYFVSEFRSFRTLFNIPYQILKIMEVGNIKAYFYDLHIVQAAKELCHKYNPSIVMSEYLYLAPYLKYAPAGALKIVDTIDVFSRKERELCGYGIEFPLACTEEEERKYLLNSDLVLGIQLDETALLRKMLPEKDIINVGVDMPVDPLSKLVSKEKILLVVGGLNNNNVHGVEAFLRESWNLICSANADVLLRVVGSVCKKVNKNLVSERVEFVGIVDDLRAEYENADIVINPVVAGTGLKIKTIEAMCYGKPLVSTPNGVEGIPVENPKRAPFEVADTYEAFVDIVVELLTDDGKRNKIAKNAVDYVSKYFSSEYIYRDLRDRLAVHEQ